MKQYQGGGGNQARRGTGLSSILGTVKEEKEAEEVDKAVVVAVRAEAESRSKAEAVAVAKGVTEAIANTAAVFKRAASTPATATATTSAAKTTPPQLMTTKTAYLKRMWSQYWKKINHLLQMRASPLTIRNLPTCYSQLVVRMDSPEEI